MVAQGVVWSYFLGSMSNRCIRNVDWRYWMALYFFTSYFLHCIKFTALLFGVSHGDELRIVYGIKRNILIS